jgi:hypothetical protein
LWLSNFVHERGVPLSNWAFASLSDIGISVPSYAVEFRAPASSRLQISCANEEYIRRRVSKPDRRRIAHNLCDRAVIARCSMRRVAPLACCFQCSP